MTDVRRLLMAAISGLALLAGCARDGDPPPAEEQPFAKELLQVARDYKSWGRVDDSIRFGIEYCRMPQPARSHFSASADADTHGQKLYSLFAKDRKAYSDQTATESAVGQVIVKEAWTPEAVKDMKPGVTDWTKVVDTKDVGPRGTRFYPYATRGDTVYRAAKPAGLFIMVKLNSKTPGTDEGWVYGTVTADGKTVTASGKIESCMKCHQEAKRDRLFGLTVRDGPSR